MIAGICNCFDEYSLTIDERVRPRVDASTRVADQCQDFTLSTVATQDTMALGVHVNEDLKV